jgi:hypothetical protein
MVARKKQKGTGGRLGLVAEHERHEAARAMFRLDPTRSTRSVSDAVKAATGKGMNQTRLLALRTEVQNEPATSAMGYPFEDDEELTPVAFGQATPASASAGIGKVTIAKVMLVDTVLRVLDFVEKRPFVGGAAAAAIIATGVLIVRGLVIMLSGN